MEKAHFRKSLNSLKCAESFGKASLYAACLLGYKYDAPQK